MADAAQEVVLDLAQLAELAVLVLDLVEQLGVPDGDADLARVQVEEGLVGSLPGARRREAGEERPRRSSPARSSARIGHRDARDPFLRLDGVRVDEQDDGRDEPECSLGVAGGPIGHGVDAVAWLGQFDRGKDQRELAIPPVGVRRQTVVALGQLGQDVRADDRDGLAHVAGGHARNRRRDLAQRPDEIEPDRHAADQADADRHREHEQEDPSADLGIDRTGRQQHQAEQAERDDRRRQQGQGQSCLEGEGQSLPAGRFGGGRHRSGGTTGGAVATSR